MAPGETRVVTATMCVPSSTTAATIALNGLAFPFTSDPQTSNNSASVDVNVATDLVFYNGFDSCP
jgi:predicted nicotinamide N-methyase